MERNNFVKGQVTKIDNHFVFVDFGDFKGRMHISEASDYFVGDLSKIFVIGNKYEFYVDYMSEIYDNTYEISFKKTVPWSLKTPFKFELKETLNGFTNIYNHKNKKLECEND